MGHSVLFRKFFEAHKDDVSGAYFFLLQKFESTCEAAYEAGWRAGADAMRQHILRAAQEPDLPLAENTASAIGQLPSLSSEGDGSFERSGASPSRAARGSVRASIQAALSAHPEGLNERELGKAMEALDPNVSGRSAGGELRRLRGRLYRFQGGKWFLIAKNGVKETAETAPAAPAVPTTQATQEEADDPATTIAA